MKSAFKNIAKYGSTVKSAPQFQEVLLVLESTSVKAIPIKCFVSHRPTDPCLWKSKIKQNSESLVKKQVL